MFVQFKIDKISYSPAVWNIKHHGSPGNLINLSILANVSHLNYILNKSKQQAKGIREMEETNPYLGQAIIEGVREQMAIDDPPEVNETYDRLIFDGHPEEEVLKMLACVLSTEMFEILKHKRVFDRQLYIRRLRDLPKLPWE